MEKSILDSAFHFAQASLRCCITSIANGVASGLVCESPVIYLVHSQSPAYPRDIVEYPSKSSLSIFSPRFNLANAPYCQRIGATSDGVPRSLSCLHINALWHSSNLSSIISQNLSMSPSEEQATSTRLMVTTPWLKRPQYLCLLGS